MIDAVPIAAPASWEDAPRCPPANAAPVLTVAGFEGPLDWLLEMARAADRPGHAVHRRPGRAFVTTLDAALSAELVRADLLRWGEWLVMTATLALLRSRLLLPPDAPEANAAQDEAEAMRRQLLECAAIRAAAEWLDGRLQLGRDVFGRGEVADATARSGGTTDITEKGESFRADVADHRSSLTIGTAHSKTSPAHSHVRLNRLAAGLGSRISAPC